MKSIYAYSIYMMKIEAYTDGACSGNPGPGAWGVLLRGAKFEKELAGGEIDTTNNRMELTAVIKALEELKTPCKIELYTDSQYVMRGYTEWMPVWIAKKWKNSTKKIVANVDLWQRLHELGAKHEISWHWVKGHDGHTENERVDALARAYIEKMLQS